MKSCQRMCLEISVDSNNDVLHAKDRQSLYQLTRPDCPCIHGWTPTTVNESVVIGPYRMCQKTVLSRAQVWGVEVDGTVLIQKKYFCAVFRGQLAQSGSWVTSSDVEAG